MNKELAALYRDINTQLVILRGHLVKQPQNTISNERLLNDVKDRLKDINQQLETLKTI